MTIPSGPSKKKHIRLFLIPIVLAAGMLLTLFFYAESTPVNHLIPVSQAMALAAVPYYHNTTYTFTSAHTSWLLVTQVGLQGIQSRYIATLYIFKLADDGRDFTVLGIDSMHNQSLAVDDQVFGIFYYSNNTVVTVGFHLPAQGTYVLDFGLKLQVYSKELFLPIAEEQVRVATNIVVHYPP